MLLVLTFKPFTLTDVVCVSGSRSFPLFMREDDADLVSDLSAVFLVKVMVTNDNHNVLGATVHTKGIPTSFYCPVKRALSDAVTAQLLSVCPCSTYVDIMLQFVNQTK